MQTLIIAPWSGIFAYECIQKKALQFLYNDLERYYS